MTTTARSIGLLAVGASLGALVLLDLNSPTPEAPTGSIHQTRVRVPIEHERPPQTVANAANEPTSLRVEAPGPAATKYRYLLEMMDARRAAEMLALLEAREGAAHENADDDRTIENRLLDRLSPAERDMYAALRDSDAEQRGVDDFLGGIAGDLPIDDRERRELLLTKLHHKRQFEQWRMESSMDLDSLSTQQRQYAHGLLERALAEYRDAYLLDMRARLDAERFQRLSDYEHTEFAIVLERLQQEINTR